MEILELRKLK